MINTDTSALCIINHKAQGGSDAAFYLQCNTWADLDSAIVSLTLLIILALYGIYMVSFSSLELSNSTTVTHNVPGGSPFYPKMTEKFR